MVRLIAIAAFVRNPAERPAIGHPHRHRLSGPGHAGRVDRRLPEDFAQCGEQLTLGDAVEKVRDDTEAGNHHDALIAGPSALS
jgi:hypothetical protein